MEIAEGNVVQFTECLEQLLIKMQEADNVCIEVTKEISKKEFSIVIFVAKKEEVIMKEIADYFNIPVSTTTGLVDKLVDKGFLRRIYSVEDRRSIKVALSKYGQSMFDLLQTTLFNMGETMLSGLTDEEQEQLIFLLQKVTTNLINYTPKPISRFG